MKKPIFSALLSAVLFCSLWLGSCDTGTLGGSDKTKAYYPDAPEFKSLLSDMTGVWYSHFDNYKLDGYRIGQWKDFDTLVGSKKDLFPTMDPSGITYNSSSPPNPGDYFVLYDDTVYEVPEGKRGDAKKTSYLGIVRAVNLFYDKKENGAIIIEYIKGCAPEWLQGDGLADGEKPFFGIYYRVKGNRDVIQMANAVDLAAFYANKPYHTETKTLAEAVQKNNVINEQEFIDWSAVTPQDREK